MMLYIDIIIFGLMLNVMMAMGIFFTIFIATLFMSLTNTFGIAKYTIQLQMLTELIEEKRGGLPFNRKYNPSSFLILFPFAYVIAIVEFIHGTFTYGLFPYMVYELSKEVERLDKENK